MLQVQQTVAECQVAVEAVFGVSIECGEVGAEEYGCSCYREEGSKGASQLQFSTRIPSFATPACVIVGSLLTRPCFPRQPRVKCTICTGLTTTPPFCQPCRKLGITGSLSDTKHARTQSSTASTSTSHIDRPPKRHKPNNVERTRPRPMPITPIIAEYGKSHSQIFDTLVPLQYSMSSDSAQNSNAANFVSPDWPLDRIIDKLATAKHFNDRGEYIFLQFLPPESLARVQVSHSRFKYAYMLTFTDSRPLRSRAYTTQNENAQILQAMPSTPTPTSTSTSSFPPQVCRSPSCGQPLHRALSPVWNPDRR